MRAPGCRKPEGTIVVQKYGGSSLADAAAIARVAQTVVDRVASGAKLVVVVSAMGGSTDALIGLAGEVSATPSRRELDMLLSTGERVTMSLLSMAIADLGVEAISFTGSQCGIITNDRHTDARIIDVRPVRVEDELARDRVVIVAGFQGMSYRRDITTLGRGGSDTTALALAAALGADACEIYSDVPGVFSADPRQISDARVIDEIGYGELETLARHGARVLHADAVAWARREGIQFRAMQTGGDGSGTTVGDHNSRGVVGVTSSRRRRYLSGHDRLEALADAVVHADDDGLLLDAENLHGEALGEPCATITIAGDRLMQDQRVLSLIPALSSEAEQWWSSPFGLHFRYPESVDLEPLLKAAHDLAN